MPAFRCDHGAYRRTGRGESDGTGNEKSSEDPARPERLALQCCASGSGQVAPCRIPVVRRFGERRREARGERSGQIWSSLGQTRPPPRQMREQVDGARSLEPPFPPKQLAKIDAVDIRHREKEETLMLA